MKLNIRAAKEKDIPRILDLLSQVLEVHAEIRPDLFVSGTRKYNESDLRSILADADRPVFVAEDETGKVIGYCFCILQHVTHSNNLRESQSLYMDDLCVDEDYRGQHVGKALCDYVVAFARERRCYDITLNVWEGNDRAREFYQKMGFGVRKCVMERIL